ncbi:MAG TPA: hypothetical protein VKB76_10425, partial [Ktedonobacterales bacterium]|nr:hypothetical protein [Ktedonobacterales bacterium]
MPKDALPTVPITPAVPVPALPATTPPVRERQSRAPMWFELFGGALLGLHGLGMLAVHRYRAAIFWLFVSAVGWALRLAVLAMTAGIGCACIVPIS